MAPYSPDRKPGVRVSAPASAANLGPGFDVLALALDMRNTYDVWELGSELRIEVQGEGAGSIATDDTNLFVDSMQTFFTLAGYQPSGLVIRENNLIPLARGLGSSAATIVSALIAARFISGHQIEDERLVDMAVSLEGHADNVGATFHGGFNLSIPAAHGRNTVRRLPWPPRLGCALFIPELLVSTESAREVLPPNYSREDVVYNLSRLALLLSALTEGRMEDLRVAVEDRMHQPYRAELVPGLLGIIDAATQAGAFGAFLSGAGPTVLAITDRDAGAARGNSIATAMAKAGASVGLEGKALVVDVSARGTAFQALGEDPSGDALTR
jgi:homoserine kinase